MLPISQFTNLSEAWAVSAVSILIIRHVSFLQLHDLWPPDSSETNPADTPEITMSLILLDTSCVQMVLSSFKSTIFSLRNTTSQAFATRLLHFTFSSVSAPCHLGAFSFSQRHWMLEHPKFSIRLPFFLSCIIFSFHNLTYATNTKDTFCMPGQYIQFPIRHLS